MKSKALKKCKNKSTNKNFKRVSLFELPHSPTAILFRASALNLSPQNIRVRYAC